MHNISKHKESSLLSKFKSANIQYLNTNEKSNELRNIRIENDNMHPNYNCVTIMH